MMKAKVGIVGGDLNVESAVKVTWILPSGQEGVLLPSVVTKSGIAVESARSAALTLMLLGQS